MKKIEAIIRPHRLDEVLHALAEIKVSGVTVLEIQGFGRQMGHSEVYRGVESAFTLVPKRMLVLYVADDEVKKTVECISKVANTEQVGDGKIAVQDMENLVRIRTGEAGDVAL